MRVRIGNLRAQVSRGLVSGDLFRLQNDSAILWRTVVSGYGDRPGCHIGMGKDMGGRKGRRGEGYSGPKAQSFLFSAPLFSQTNGAKKRTNGAEKRTNGAEKRTNGAEKRTNGAEKRTNGAEKRTNGAEKRKCTLGPP